MRVKQRTALASLLAVVLFSTAGCRVNNSKNGDKENVDISTPFGGMSVKTDKNFSAGDAGFASYPGATSDPDKNEKNGKDANVDMHFGEFRLRVKVMKFITTDSTDKVLAFYKDDMGKRYGDVLECKGKNPIGSKTATSQGLTCDSDKSKNNTKVIHLSLNEQAEELRSGSKQHQHVVSVEPRSTGSKFALIEVDLPGSGSDAD